MQKALQRYPDYPFFGFEDLFSSLDRISTQTYPPCNIYVEDSDPNNIKHIIELACAGFKKSDLTVQTQKNTVTVSGEKKDSSVNTARLVKSGLAGRSFTRTFESYRTLKVDSVVYEDGVLTIVASEVIPEKEKILTHTIT